MDHRGPIPKTRFRISEVLTETRFGFWGFSEKCVGHATRQDREMPDALIKDHNSTQIVER
jgi:hypothetical protein